MGIKEKDKVSITYVGRNDMDEEIKNELYLIKDFLIDIFDELEWISHGGREKFAINKNGYPFIYKMTCPKCKMVYEDTEVKKIEDLKSDCWHCDGSV